MSEETKTCRVHNLIPALEGLLVEAQDTGDYSSTHEIKTIYNEDGTLMPLGDRIGVSAPFLSRTGPLIPCVKPEGAPGRCMFETVLCPACEGHPTEDRFNRGRLHCYECDDTFQVIKVVGEPWTPNYKTRRRDGQQDQ